MVFVLLLAGAAFFLRPADDGGDEVISVPGVWSPLPPSGLPGRTEAAAVWTRQAMIVWGGNGDAGLLGDGASYDLPTATWRPLPPSPLVPRRGHSAVWTGSKMLVYGGLGADGEGCPAGCVQGDAAAYDPAADTWTPVAQAPIEGRSGHAAVWVQNRMVVWGGAASDGRALGDGASYDPATDTWTSLPPSPLEPRVGHRAVATTHRMLVWGGSSEAEEGGRYFADGAVYSPVTNSWAGMAAAPPGLAPRDNLAAVWTGEQLLVWGGYGRTEDCTPCFFADGAAYDLSTDSWSTIAASPLSGRGGHRAVWTGRDMLVWGGFDHTELGDGALYNPTTDAWDRLVPGPLPRQHPVMLWTGQQLLVWGGQGATAKRADGALLTLTYA